jgi:hypothetical protein
MTTAPSATSAFGWGLSDLAHIGTHKETSRQAAVCSRSLPLGLALGRHAREDD